MPNRFESVLGRLRSEGRNDDAGHAAQALATYEAGHRQSFENLSQDPHIDGPYHVGRETREDLLEDLRGVDPQDAGAVEGEIVEFCRSHQLHGPRHVAAESMNLGHVEERRKTEATLGSVGLSRAPLARRQVRIGLLVDDLLNKDLAGQKSILGSSRLGRWLMWSFFAPAAATSPFDAATKVRAELIRRLGLGCTDPRQELLLWEHRLQPPQTAHTPTAYDAETYEFFRPGGATRPLDGVGDGLDEVVHLPVSGEQLATRIERAT